MTAEEKLDQLRQSKRAIVRSDAEDRDFDKLVIGALSQETPQVMWELALLSAEAGIMMLREQRAKEK